MSEDTPTPPERKGGPRAVLGAFTRGGRATDAHVRDLVKMLIQGGAVGIALVALFLVYVGMTRVASSLDRVGNTLAVQAKALDSHLDEDLKNELADRVAARLTAQDKDFRAREEPVPKPKRVPKPKPIPPSTGGVPPP